MADIKIYGTLVANTEDQVVADASSIQDTTRNQKLSVTLNELAQGTGLKVLDVNLNNYLSQDGLLALIQGINYATVGDAISYQFSSSIAVDSSYNAVHVTGSVSGQGGIDLYLLKSINDKFSCETLVSDGYNSKYKTIQNATLITSSGYIRGIVVTNELVGNLCDLVNGRSELTTTKLTYWFPVGILPTHIKLANDIIVDLQGNEYCAIGNETIDAEISNRVYLNVVKIDINGDFSNVSANDVKVVDFLWQHIENPNNFSFDDLPRFSDSSDVADFPGTSSDGQGGGSGASTTEFHAENGLIQMKGVYTAGGLDYTISSYISGKDLLAFVLAMKQASPLFRDLPFTQDTTTAELIEILQNAMDSVNQNVLAGLGYYFLEAGFGISIDQAGFGVNGEGVSSLNFDDSGTFPNGDAYAYYSYKGGQKQLLFYANDVTNATFELNELTSGEITISGGSGSGGSGKLYDITFDLSLYDQNGDIAKWSSNLLGIQNANSLRFSLLIYESNFERLKTKFNALAQQMSLTISIDEPQDLVNIFNTAFNKTTSSSSTEEAMLLMLTIQYADKCLVYGANNIQQFYVTGYVGLTITLGFIGTSGIENHALLDWDAEQQIDIPYGLNVNNSCTLTEYGTSASGGDTPSQSESSYTTISIAWSIYDIRFLLPKFEETQFVTNINQMVAAFNQLMSLSLPTISSYADLETLYNAVSGQVYESVVLGGIIWAINYDSVSVQCCSDGPLRPAFTSATLDIANNSVEWSIDILQLNNGNVSSYNVVSDTNFSSPDLFKVDDLSF